MATSASADEGTLSGPFSKWPGEGLRAVKRVITGHDSEGNSVFVANDSGDHQGVMVDGIAVQNCIYSTQSVPVDINDGKDLKWAKENKPGVTVPNGTLARMIDFAPGCSSNLHRSVALVYGVVIEGEFEVSLGGGEKQRMLPGDTIVNRSAMHRWRNVSASEPGRMLFVLVDVKPVIVNGTELGFDLGNLANSYD